MGKTLIKRGALLLMTPLFLLLSSCGDEGCTEQVTAYAVGTFEKEKTTETVISKLLVYGIGQEKDSLMAAQTTLKVVDLIFNSSDTITKTDFRFVVDNDTISDTLTFYYTNRDFFLNIDCGCSVFHTIDSIEHTSNLIKEIEIINSDITNEKTPNFTIRY
ncbi:MAG: DUF6452 family protein [Bacteroidales bacterium]